MALKTLFFVLVITICATNGSDSGNVTTTPLTVDETTTLLDDFVTELTTEVKLMDESVTTMDPVTLSEEIPENVSEKVTEEEPEDKTLGNLPSLDSEQVQSDQPDEMEMETEDMDFAETGSIDLNLIDSNFVGRYNGNQCRALGTSVINLLECCSFTAGPLDISNVRKCCIPQGSNCNYDPNMCCNYLQMACLPDPILSGIFTCQKVDTYRPRVAPLGYSVPLSYLPVGNNYGINYQQNYGPRSNYVNDVIQNDPPQVIAPPTSVPATTLSNAVPVQTTTFVISPQAVPATTFIQPQQVPTTTTFAQPQEIQTTTFNVPNQRDASGTRRSLAGVNSNNIYQQIVNNVVRSIQNQNAQNNQNNQNAQNNNNYRIDPLNIPLYMRK